VLEAVADRVFEELKGDGYKPNVHDAEDEPGEFEIRLRGDHFDLNDFKSMVAIGERFGLGMRIDQHGWITFR
jgi:hypothetical protein